MTDRDIDEMCSEFGRDVTGELAALSKERVSAATFGQLKRALRARLEVSGSAAPLVDACIAEVMHRFPGTSETAGLRYYEAVHQALAPLARRLEAENAGLRARLAGYEA